MDKSNIYKKEDSYFIKPPAMTSYTTYKDGFSWDDEAGKFFHYFEDGKINAAYEASDVHLNDGRINKKALIWEGDNGEKEEYTFKDLSALSNKVGNYLKSLGVSKGDRVFIFLPRIPMLFFSFLGILKIGAVAGSLFSAFQPKALFDRLENSEASILITNRELSERLTEIRADLPSLKKILIVDDDEFKRELNMQADSLEIEKMDPNDSAFMLYTSGTTGKPKGVVHSHKAILSQNITSKIVLDLRDDDIYWCTADPGWVTGIAYEILGPWSMGVTEVIFSGRFDPDKWYQIIENYKITVWYTAPTAVRMLMAKGKEISKKYNLTTLRHILSVGEPLNPEAIKWGIEAFNLAFHDTWWQTETGCIMIANYLTMDMKIGSMGKPFPGITASIVNDKGEETGVNKEGNIAIRPGWPSMMKEIWKNTEKYQSYFSNGWYISGDRGWIDEDGYFWFIGRADDVIKTSGERVGPFEVESALVSHPHVTEAGVIGKPDALRGEIIKAFVVLDEEYKKMVKEDPLKKEELIQELSVFVKKHLAGHAYPREIEFTDKLPKTRSGKIMRRILKAKELGLEVGDTSTLEDF